MPSVARASTRTLAMPTTVAPSTIRPLAQVANIASVGCMPGPVVQVIVGWTMVLAEHASYQPLW